MIAAVESCSLVDFPGRLAAVAFTQGCDLRCRYCHNPELCEPRSTNPQVLAEFLGLLSRRRGLLSGVVVCGGEPTLWGELATLLQRLRSLGFATKLDTNGLHPKRTNALVGQGLVDYLAVDIKAAPGERSRWLCGHDRQAELAVQTLAQASRLGVTCEARTVLVRGVHDVGVLSWIAENLADNGIKRWRLRDVRGGKVLDSRAPLVPPERPMGMHALALGERWSLDVQYLG
jgi:pyruvate formate lyase activating enzyme